jgi:hypothetical protein
MATRRLSPSFDRAGCVQTDRAYRDKLAALLSQDLDFHGEDSGYASRNYHSFPAKFPPQLPHKFIEALTEVGDVVLDPMLGSGTTMVEAALSGRRGIGCAIDPLALLLSKVKVTRLDVAQLAELGDAIVQRATRSVRDRTDELEKALNNRWDAKTRRFVDYWFARSTRLELEAIVCEIARVDDAEARTFLELAFSGIVITKSGGVSLAFDLAHTRPHCAKVAYAQTGEVVLGHDLVDSHDDRVKLLAVSRGSKWRARCRRRRTARATRRAESHQHQCRGIDGRLDGTYAYLELQNSAGRTAGSE